MRHDHREMYEHLSRARTLVGTPPEALRALSYVLRRVEMDAGDTVFRQGDAGEDAFLVLEGELDIVTSADGEEHVVATFGPGELFGELALFGSGKRSAGARAKTRLALGAVAFDKFLAIVRAWPETALALLRLQAERLAAAERERGALVAQLRASR